MSDLADQGPRDQDAERRALMAEQERLLRLGVPLEALTPLSMPDLPEDPCE